MCLFATCAIVNFSSISLSPDSTAGTFMTSAKPMTSGLSIKVRSSSAVSEAPEVSNGVAGTHDGNMKRMSTAASLASCSMNRMPSSPHTLAISCGSATMVVVPLERIKRANSVGRSIEDSICTCASIKPGTSMAFSRSISDFP